MSTGFNIPCLFEYKGQQVVARSKSGDFAMCDIGKLDPKDNTPRVVKGQCTLNRDPIGKMPCKMQIKDKTLTPMNVPESEYPFTIINPNYKPYVVDQKWFDFVRATKYPNMITNKEYVFPAE